MINNIQTARSNEAKAATETEQMWVWLDGSHYDGIRATPERFYTELTAAMFAGEPKDFIRLAQIIERRFKEIAVLQQEMTDLQSMLVQSQAAYDKAKTA